MLLTQFAMILGNGKQNKNKRDNYYDEYNHLIN
jgi:hypothetical protein